MPLSEIFSLAGPTAQTSSTGERPDESRFAELLGDQAPVQTRGRFGTARWVEDQALATDRMNGHRGHSILMDSLLPLINPAVLNGGAGAGAKPASPLINPGPGDESKPELPLINPGPQADAKATGPLINPGPGEAKPDQPLVLPGSDEGKAQQPLVLPTDLATTGIAESTLQVMSAQGQVQSAAALVQAAQQAVTRAPEITSTLPAVEPEPASAGDSISTDTDPTASSLVADTVPSPADSVSPAPGAAAVQSADAASTGTRAEPVEVQPMDDGATDLTQVEADLPAASTTSAATGTGHEGSLRMDAASLAGRLSFDSLAQVSAQIIRRLEMRTTRFDIELNPVELGRVDVRLDIDSEGRLAARLAFDNPAAALELRGRVDDLRRELQQAGFHLADDAFSFTDRGGSDDRRSALSEDARRAHARSAAAADQVDVAAQPVWRASARLGLDVKV